MKKTAFNFFSNTKVQIAAAILALVMVLGAAAMLLPAAQPADQASDCLHPLARLINTGETDDGTEYVFRCPTCMATIHETPETSSFILHKPTVANGVAVMNSPWEIGAYYDDGYRVFTAKVSDDGWFSDGVLWQGSTGVRVQDTMVGMLTHFQGDAAVTYVAQEDGYVHPYFESVMCQTPAKSCEFAIYLNGERAAPEDGNFVFYSTSPGTVVLTEDLNELFADSWIRVEKGDKISFTIIYNGTQSTEFILDPAVEFLHYNPNRK